MLQRRGKRYAKIGVFAIGHAVYWDQFPGLLQRLLDYHRQLAGLIEAQDVELVDFGMVDSSQRAYAAAARMEESQLDLVFCNMVTYGTSATFAPIVRNVRAPLVLTALQPRRALDYDRASTVMQLENDNICSVPEFTNVAQRMGRPVEDVIIGTLFDDHAAEAALADWCDIAKVLHDLRGARLGLTGHAIEAMYDMHSDPTAISRVFNLHVPLLEIDDLAAVYEDVTNEEITRYEELILQEFELPDPKSDPITRKLTDADLQQGARTAAALERFVDKYDLTGLAYYYEGRDGSIQREIVNSLIVGNSILNARGIPMCGEFDIKTCIAMLIMDRLDMGGSFAELHPLDFEEDFVLVGHDGPHHMAIAEERPILRSLVKYHGKPGGGASVEFKLREGPITMCGIAETGDGSFKFIVGEGFSQRGPIPPTGNTNTRGVFAPHAKDFVKAWVMAGPTHHFALGIGHRAAAFQKLAKILGLECVVVQG